MPLIYVLIIMVGVAQTPLTVEFTSSSRCYIARDAIRNSVVGQLTYVECFAK
jgi:hypothetical protein